MKHESQSHSISFFQEHYKSGRLELSPPFQRKPVWLDKQRSALIESILMGIPVPEIYVQVTTAEDGSEHFGVVDGQQRLRTILQFVGIESEDDRDGEDNNSFPLDALPATSEFQGMSFADLSAPQRKAFFQFQICVRYLYTDSRSEIEDVFKRLNKYALPLKPQELRNATYHNAFATLSEVLADNEYWAVNRIILPSSIRRMGDIEMMSDLLIGLIHGPQGGSAATIDEYYQSFEAYEDEFPGQPKIKRLFDETLTAIQSIFPSLPDMPRWGNRTDFYSLFVALGAILKKEDLSGSHVKSLRTALEDFGAAVDTRMESPSARDADAVKAYARAVEKGSNDKARRADRHSILLELMAPLVKKKKKHDE